MNVLFAAGISTTTDDRGYWLWFSDNWIDCVVPALLFGTFLIIWLVRRIRAWTSKTPGSSTSAPGALCQSTEVPQESKGTVQSGQAEHDITCCGGSVYQAAT